MSILADNAIRGATPSLRAPSANASSEPRDTVRWVTIAKAVAILLMVYGHVWRGILNSIAVPTSLFARACNTADAVIYAFHMPLFFFLSGMFVERSVAKSTRSFFDRKLRTIVYPYMVWSVLQCLVASAAPSANRPLPFDALRGLLIRPYMQFWFLYVLVLCMSSYWVMHALKLGAKAFLAVTILAYIGGPFVHLASLNPVLAAIADWGPLYEYRSYAIYFALGAVAGPWALKYAPRLGQRPAWAITGLGIAAVAALVLPVESEHWQYVLAPAAAVMGMAAMFAASIAIARRPRPLLEAIGEATLPIFAAHVIFAAAVRVFLSKGLHLTNAPLHLIAGSLIGVALPMALRVAASRTGIPLFSLTFAKKTRKPPRVDIPPAAPELKPQAPLPASSAA